MRSGGSDRSAIVVTTTSPRAASKPARIAFAAPFPMRLRTSCSVAGTSGIARMPSSVVSASKSYTTSNSCGSLASAAARPRRHVAMLSRSL